MVRFADAASAFDDARFVIFSVPVDVTCSFRRGTRLAPLAIRLSSFNFETWHPEELVDLTDIAIHDAGDIGPDPEDIRRIVSRAIATGKTPIMLGGEHSITVGACAAHDWDVLYVDAHADYRDDYLGDRGSHATVARRLIEMGHRIVHVGARSFAREEFEAFQRDVEVVPPGATVKEVVGRLAPGKIYLTIDMDSIDPSDAPGVGNPEAGGLSARYVMELISALGPRIGAMDIVEVCPPFDPDGRTAALAAKMVGRAIACIAR
ncbi:MAG: agmatinase [Thermoplasmata archaeon]|nr:agmatinase [Thermoplasmata archaeon]